MYLSSNAIGDSNNEFNFQHKLFLTNTQVLRLRKTSGNNSSANVKLLKIQLRKTRQSGEFSARILGQLLKTGLSLIKNALKLFAKSASVPLGLASSAWARDTAIQKKIFGSGMTTLTISNEGMNDIMKTIKSFEQLGLLIKGVSKTIKNVVKEPKGGFLGMSLGTWGSSLLGNLSTGKGVK